MENHPSSLSSSSLYDNRINNATNVGTFFSITNASQINQLNSTNQIITIDSNGFIEHLQQQLQQEQAKRLELENELSSLKQKYSDLKFLHDKCSINEIDEYIHECNECNQFKTKSNVSLILHQMNHKIIDKNKLLLSTFFTTRNSNSKPIYKCSACDVDNLTRHQIYRHIYDLHTMEKPLSCPYCEFSFTHIDYLKEHLQTKHCKNVCSKIVKLNKNYEHLNFKNNNNNNYNKSTLTKTTITKKQQLSMSNKELKCSFPDCNFVTLYQDKLDFHIEAHLMSKYKCPCCPYVSNTLIDIKKHMQKSKKHEGSKMFTCRICCFAVNCERQFKEHLRASHFGYEEKEDTINYFIEEMFLNKNKQQNDNESKFDKDKTVLLSIIDSKNNENYQKSSNNNVSLIPPLKKLALLKDQQQNIAANNPNNNNIVNCSSGQNYQLPSIIKDISLEIVSQNNNDEQHQSHPQAILSFKSSHANLNQQLNHGTMINVNDSQATNITQNSNQSSTLTTTIEEIPVVMTTQYINYSNY